VSRWRRIPSPVVWTAAVAGVSVLYMAFVVPLGAAPDEAEHAFRAYQLSLGTLFPQIVSCAKHPNLLPCKVHYPGHLVPHRRVGGRISAALYQVFKRLGRGGGSHFNPRVYTRELGKALGGSATVYANFENTALYSPANYVPQTVVFWIGRELSMSVIATLLVARVVTGIVWAGLVTASVALVPRWKWLFALVVLVPTALAQGPTLSADSMTLGLAALTIAYALRLAERGAPPRNAELAALGALGLLVGMLKAPLPLVMLAALVIVWPVLGRHRGRVGRVAVIAIPAIVAAAWWNVETDAAYFVPYRNAIFPPSEQVYISQAGQAHYLLTHLYDVPALLWQTAVNGHLFRLDGVVGTLGPNPLTGSLPEWFALLWLALFVVLAVGSSEGVAPRWRLRLWLAGTVVAYVLLVALALYLTWTAVGNGRIDGISGRYFTPALTLLIPLLAGLGGTRVRFGQSTVARAVMITTTLAAVALFVHTAQHFYHQAPWQVVPRVVSALL
jgi:uncharacterized membrane protein